LPFLSPAESQAFRVGRASVSLSLACVPPLTFAALLSLPFIALWFAPNLLLGIFDVRPLGHGVRNAWRGAGELDRDGHTRGRCCCMHRSAFTSDRFPFAGRSWRNCQPVEDIRTCVSLCMCPREAALPHTGNYCWACWEAQSLQPAFLSPAESSRGGAGRNPHLSQCCWHPSSADSSSPNDKKEIENIWISAATEQGKQKVREFLTAPPLPVTPKPPSRGYQ
jgi:hypothetical protein